jgi:hypothetical protein
VRYLIIDVLFVVIVGLFTTVTVALIRTWSNNLPPTDRKLQQLGRRNLKELEEEAKFICVQCSKRVDPVRDIHNNGWWCKGCYPKL